MASAHLCWDQPDFLENLGNMFLGSAKLARDIRRSVESKARQSLAKATLEATNAEDYAAQLSRLLEHTKIDENMSMEQVTVIRDMLRFIEHLHRTYVALLKKEASGSPLQPVVGSLEQVGEDLDLLLEDLEDSVRFQPELQKFEQARESSNG